MDGSVRALTCAALSAAGVSEFSRARGEPEFLLGRRLQALAAWDALPLPGRQDEVWRRVKLPELNWEQLTAREAGGEVQRLSNGGAVPGVFWGALAAAARDRLDLLRALFAAEIYPAGNTGTGKRGGKFHALNQALFDSGYVLHVGAGVRTEEPYAATFATRPADGVYPHNLVVLEENSAATVVERYHSPAGRGGFCVPQTEVLLRPGARLHYVLLQETGAEVIHLAAHRAKMLRGARMVWASAHLGAGLAKCFLEAELAEPGGDVELYGLYYGRGGQKLHLDTWQHHVAPACRSDLKFKGVLDDSAQAVYRGTIRLEPDAQKTDAYQQNRTLLLSPDATVHSIPALEIMANDVRCTHGATAGQVDQEMLFYLRSRGLTRAQARRMIVDGFLEEVVLKFEPPGCQSAVRELLEARQAGAAPAGPA